MLTLPASYDVDDKLMKEDSEMSLLGCELDTER
jgi:hypothetical protein